MIITYSQFPWITLWGFSLCSTAVIILEVEQSLIAKPILSKFQISFSWILYSWIASCIVSNYCFITFRSSCFTCWYDMCWLYCVHSTGWCLIKLYIQLMPINVIESCVHSQSKICAILHRNSGWIEKPYLSAFSSCLIRTSSSITVNL